MVDIKFHCDIKGNFPDGFLVRGFSYKNYFIEMHNHDFYELNIILSGTGTHCIENGRFAVKPGDVFVIPPMVAHAYIDTKSLEVYHILLQKNFILNNSEESAKVKGFLQLTEIEPFLRSNFSNAAFLSLSNLQLSLLRNDLDFLDDSSIFSWQDHTFMKYHTAWKILYWFSGILYEQITSAEIKTHVKYERQIIQSLEYIHKNYHQKITIDDLCNQVYLSRSTFLRNFQAVCSTSPMEYLNNYRCQKAIEYSDTFMYTKTEIAHKCGFYDLSHMERMLKKKR